MLLGAAPAAVPPPVPDRAGPAGPYRVGGWLPETRAIVAVAAVVSVLSLGLWVGLFWQYLHPGAFSMKMLFGQPHWLNLATFFLRPLLHAGILAGAALAAARRPEARIVLLAAGWGVLAAAAYNFIAPALFPVAGSAWPGLPDLLYALSSNAVRTVAHCIPHALLVVAMSQPRVRQLSRAQGGERDF